MYAIQKHTDTAWNLFVASPRHVSFDTTITIGLFVSLLLLALAKLYKSDVFSVLKHIFVRNSNIVQLVRENYNLRNIGNYILLVNFWLLCSLGSLLLYNNSLATGNTHNIPFWFFISWPILLFLWQFIALLCISFISGFTPMRYENTLNLVILPQFFGLIMFPLILIWQLNPLLEKWMLIAFFIVIAFMFLFLILKGIIFSIRQRVSLYYIILYICTLEILPLIVIYYDFIRKM